MQQITGRLTADAVVRTTTGGKDVVSFNIADNQSYKPKNGDVVNIPTYFNCSYWIGTGVAKVLRKGAVVQLNGRITARAYTSNTGDMGASLNFNVGRIDVLAYAGEKREGSSAAAANDNSTKKADGAQPEAVDDLPF